MSEKKPQQQQKLQNPSITLVSKKFTYLTLQICAWEIPRKVVFFEIFLHWFKCTNYSLYDIKKYFQKYNWKYHLPVLGTVIKCPKGTGSAWETSYVPRKVVFLTVNIFAVQHYILLS